MIETMRQHNEANGFAFQKYCQEIMQELHGIPDDDQLEYCTSSQGKTG